MTPADALPQNTEVPDANHGATLDPSYHKYYHNIFSFIINYLMKTILPTDGT